MAAGVGKVLPAIAIFETGLSTFVDAQTAWAAGDRIISSRVESLKAQGKDDEAAKLDTTRTRIAESGRMWKAMGQDRSQQVMTEINDRLSQGIGGYATHLGDSFLKADYVNPSAMFHHGYGTADETTDAYYDATRQRQNQFYQGLPPTIQPFVSEQAKGLSPQHQDAVAQWLTTMQREGNMRGAPWWDIPTQANRLWNVTGDKLSLPGLIGQTLGGQTDKFQGHSIRNQWLPKFLATSPTPEAMGHYASSMYPEVQGVSDRDAMIGEWQSSMPQADEVYRSKPVFSPALNRLGNQVGQMRGITPG